MKKARGTWWMRSGILLLAALFGVLVYWSVGFLLDDIHVFRRPDWEAFSKARADSALPDNLEALERRLEELGHQHTLLEQQREFIRDSSGSLQVTVDNLFRLKDRNQQLVSAEQFGQVLASLDKIIAIQGEFQATAERYVQITSDQFELRKSIAALKKRIRDQAEAIRREYDDALRRQQIRTTLLRLALLLPLVVVATVVLVRKRDSMYRLIFASTAVALGLKTVLVIHERFPTRHFKYVVTACLLALVGGGFVWLIRRLVRPKLDLLLKQYRQAYEHYLCPVCEYPIRRGPRQHLYWTRRTVHKVALAPTDGRAAEADQPYVCPTCGTALFEKCASCGAIRHSLLPACQACGATKTLDDSRY
ncbi:MAG: hypothetical protein AB7V14_12160 [Kiritimatiellia bacterium]